LNTEMGRIHPIVTDELDEFEEKPVEVQDVKKIINHLRVTYGIYRKLLKNPERSQHVTSWT
jgi:hypothetical protein